MTVTMNYDKLDAFLLENPDMPVEAVQEYFPSITLWAVRNRRRAVLRTGGEIVSDGDIAALARPAQNLLRAGFFRPLAVTLNERPRGRRLFNDAATQTLVISDVHAPDEDPRAMDVATQIGQALAVDRLIIAGDGMDVHSLSKYTPSAHRPIRWVDERREAVKPFIRLREEFPDTPITYLYGNHEARVQTFLASQAPQLQGILSMPELLGIDSLGFEFPEGNRVVMADGQLLIKHGVKVSGEAAASVQKEVRAHGMSVMMGHVHRLAYYSLTRTSQQLAGAQPLVGVELGCLCNIRPDYIVEEETANWQQGCAVVTEFGNGLYHVEMIPIFEGTAFFRGKQFRSRV